MKTRIFAYIIFAFLTAIFPLQVSGQEEEGAHGSGNQKEEKFNPSEFIMDHIGDSHEWHILTRKNGESVAIYLPVIVYNKKSIYENYSLTRKLKTTIGLFAKGDSQ